MTLYREDSTGFLVEYGSSPGVGYTAISAMPTDTIDNEVAWHRALDIYGQNSTWHPSLPSGAEDPSPLALSLLLSNDAHLVSADATGTVTDSYAGANTTISVYRGSTDVFASEGWSLSVAPTNCTVFVSGATVTVTAMTANTAYVDVTASRTGSPSLVSTFSLAKAIKGATGATGPSGTNGTNGVRGSSQIVVSGSSWTDAAAWSGIVSQTGTNPVLTDMVTISSGSFTQSKFYAGGGNGSTTFGTWTSVSKFIDGNLLVTGTVGADKLVAESITADKISVGTITADRIIANQIGSSKLTNGSTSSIGQTGGAFTCSNSAYTAVAAGVSTYNSPPSGGRNNSSTPVSLIATGTLRSSASVNLGWTIRITKNGSPISLGGNTSIFVNQASVSANNGVDFAISGLDYLGSTDTANYSIDVYTTTSGANGTTTCSWGILAIENFK